MHVQALARRRKESRNGRRFLTGRDMAIAKLDESIGNSKIKRGEIKVTNTQGLTVCGCGVEGCLVPWSREVNTRDFKPSYKVMNRPDLQRSPSDANPYHGRRTGSEVTFPSDQNILIEKNRA